MQSSHVCNVHLISMTGLICVQNGVNKSTNVMKRDGNWHEFDHLALHFSTIEYHSAINGYSFVLWATSKSTEGTTLEHKIEKLSKQIAKKNKIL